MASTLFQLRRENIIDLPPMRAWQARTVLAIRQAIREGHKRIVVQSPTGAGKTLLAGHLFAGSIAKGKRPIFTVPDITLVEQTLKSFNRVGIHDVGIIQSQHERTDHEAQVQIASVQTLIRRQLPEVDLVMVDECHVIYEGLYKLMDGPAWKTKIIIGLSATPWARGMGLRWTKLIIGATIKELIEEKILCTYTAFGPGKDIDRSSVPIVKGEFDEARSSAVMSESAIVGDVVETWKKMWGRDRTFMFCVDRKHAKLQQAKFEEAGIPFGYIDGTMSIEERLPVFADYRAGCIKGIASVGCLIRGVDEDVRYIIDAQLTNSEMALVQKCGRGLRNNEPGKNLLIADHAGNQREYLFDEIYHDTLDSRPPRSKEKAFSGDKPPKPLMCPACNTILRYGTVKCSLCGTVIKVDSPVRHRDGELVEYKSGGRNSERPAENRQQFYSGFLYLARERGKSDGWAAHRFREKFGAWPDGLRKEPQPPSREVVSFDKYCRIKWAKSQQAKA